ncbi:hypothetical protein AGMMS50256_35860 [Betaproteobacteria bacterium]|nr:hypothetical protein AGMMS50256_35860 [Betaproteobacteria bacterium]
MLDFLEAFGDDFWHFWLTLLLALLLGLGLKLLNRAGSSLGEGWQAGRTGPAKRGFLYRFGRRIGKCKPAARVFDWLTGLSSSDIVALLLLSALFAVLMAQ